MRLAGLSQVSVKLTASESPPKMPLPASDWQIWDVVVAVPLQNPAWATFAAAADSSCLPSVAFHLPPVTEISLQRSCRRRGLHRYRWSCRRSGRESRSWSQRRRSWRTRIGSYTGHPCPWAERSRHLEHRPHPSSNPGSEGLLCAVHSVVCGSFCWASSVTDRWTTCCAFRPE